MKNLTAAEIQQRYAEASLGNALLEPIIDSVLEILKGLTQMTTLPIVGARFRPPADEVLKLLPSGTKLLLRRQPDNPYDENAVQVLLPGFTEEWADIAVKLWEDEETVPDFLHLGFIPREAAKELAPQLDKAWADEGWCPEAHGYPEISGILTFSLTGLPAVSFEALFWKDRNLTEK